MIELVIPERQRSLGGFNVGRVLPAAARRMVGPFIFLDHMGPLHFSAGVSRDVDVRPHPHIGLATVTYLFEGEIMHRDSVGSEATIRPGELNWMIAGRGITHSERFERARAVGDAIHGLQSWVALPKEHEETDPSFAHHGADELPTLEDRNVWTRLLAGQAFGRRSAARTHSPLFYLHCVLAEGARFALPDRYPERAAYVVSGSIATEGQTFGPGQMIVFAAGAQPVLTALTSAVVMALGGEPVGPRYIEWNFVSSSQERIGQAKADWLAQRMKLPKGDDAEFIPLPEERAAAPPHS